MKPIKDERPTPSQTVAIVKLCYMKGYDIPVYIWRQARVMNTLHPKFKLFIKEHKYGR